MIVYWPSAVGVQDCPKLPFESLVTVPISVEVPAAFTAVSLTATPAAFIGLGTCICRYSIQARMLVSEIAGVSFEDSV